MLTTRALVLAAALPLAVATGCGSSTSSGTAAGDTSSAASSPSSASSETASSGSSPSSSTPPTAGRSTGIPATGPLDVCRLVPLATVVSITGRSAYQIAKPGSGKSQGARVDYCQYTDVAGDAAQWTFGIVVYRGGKGSDLMTGLSKATGGAKPVSGIGDAAQASARELDVRTANTVVVVSDVGLPSSASPVREAVLLRLAHLVLGS